MPDMREARSGLSVVTFGNSIFAIGGEVNDSEVVLNSVERFDFDEGAWKHCFDLNTPRHGHRFDLFVRVTDTYLHRRCKWGGGKGEGHQELLI